MIRRHRTEATRPKGWQNPSSIDSAYDEALAFLGKRDSRKVAPNTYLIQGDGNALVRYHGNLIVIYEPGRITLNSQGYRTYTTKERINWFLPAGYGLYQERHQWFVQGPEGTQPFEDGMTLTSRGGGLGEPRRHHRRPPPRGRRPHRARAATAGEYQGWANWETWNVALWFGNDEGLYYAVREHPQRFTARSAKDFVMELLPDGTPDFQNRAEGRDEYRRVRWGEIARAFNEMRSG